MSPMRALDIARDRDLDLVEVAPNANPPVCRLMDYGRYKYEQAKKENEARKNQKTITLKEIRIHPRTDEHDIDVRIRKIQEFLADGDKVRVSVQFRGAEMRHPDIGRRLLDQIAEALKGVAAIERTPIMEGRMMSMIMSRAPGWEPPKKQAPASKQSEALKKKTSATNAPTDTTATADTTDTADTVDTVDTAAIDNSAPDTVASASPSPGTTVAQSVPSSIPSPQSSTVE